LAFSRAARDGSGGGMTKSTQYLALSIVTLLAACANTTPIQITSVGKSEFEGAVHSGQLTDVAIK
jgi:hypothetical protein